jgi:hypothetical protein
VTDFIPGGTDGGSYRDRPTWDKNSCVDVKQTKEEPLIYSIDLERFGKLWSAGTVPMNGVTLMVDPKISPPAPDQTWRVVFNTQRRADQKTEEEKTKPEDSRNEFSAPKWTLQYRVEKAPTVVIGPVGGGTTTGGGGGGGNPFPVAEPPPEESFGGGGGTPIASGDTGGSGSFGTSGAPATGSTGSIDAPPADSGAAPVDAPVAAAPNDGGAAAPVAAGPTQPVSAPGVSPAVWILPLLALAMAGAMAWSLMQPVQLVGDREGAVSRLMRTRRLNAQNTPTPS